MGQFEVGDLYWSEFNETFIIIILKYCPLVDERHYSFLKNRPRYYYETEERIDWFYEWNMGGLTLISKGEFKDE